MPGIDGFEATTLIRKWERSCDYPPSVIVALTAHNDDPIRQRAKEAGVDAFLSKPVDMKQLESFLAGFKTER